MTPTYIVKLDFTPQVTHVCTHNIDNLALETYGMALAGFSL